MIKLAVNQTSHAGEGHTIRGQLQKVVDRFVNNNGGEQPLKLEFVGDIRTDPSVRHSVQKRLLLLEAFPGCEAAQGVLAIAAKLTS